VHGLGQAIPIDAVGVALKFRFAPGPGKAGIPLYGDEGPAAAASASRAEVSEWMRGAVRDVDERAEMEGKGTAAQSSLDDACSGS